MKKFVNWLEYNDSLIFLLVSELLLFVSFDLLDATFVFRILAMLIMAVTLPLSIRGMGRTNLRNMLVVTVPLFLYLLVMVIFNIGYRWGDVSQNLVLLVGLVSFLLVGFNAAGMDKFRIDRPLQLIIAGLGVLVSLSFAYTMIRYAPFYVTRFAGQTIYFDGEKYFVSLEAKWLVGLYFKEVKVPYFSQYALLASSGILGLLFYPFAGFRKKDILFFIFPVIGILAIVFLPDLETLLYLLPALAIILTSEFYPRGDRYKKILKVLVIAGLSVFVLSAVFLSLYGLKAGFAVNLVENNVIFRKLFGNSLVQGYAEILGGLLIHPFGGNNIVMSDSSRLSTFSFFFDSLNQGGIPAGVFLIMVFISLAIILTGYIRTGQDEKHIRYMILSIIVTYFFYTILKYQLLPFVRESDRNTVIPFVYDFMLMPVLFLVGYAARRRTIPE